jgi:hypothetical protein
LDKGKYEIKVKSGTNLNTYTLDVQLEPAAGGWSVSATVAGQQNVLWVETKQDGTRADHGFSIELTPPSLGPMGQKGKKGKKSAKGKAKKGKKAHAAAGAYGAG